MTGPNRGFTLIEVLVALLVLTLASAVIFEGFSTGFRNARTADEFAEAVLIAQSRLAPVGIAEPLAAGVATGTEGDKYAWTVRVEPIAPEADESEVRSPVQPYHVTVDVVWGSGTAERSVSLSSLRLGAR